jgi:hypothetical protein
LPRGIYKRTPRQSKQNSLITPRIMSTLVTETDEQIDARLREMFDIVGIMASSACRGQARALIVSGPAGLGKSFTVESVVSDYDDTGKKAAICKGFIRPTGLYKTLYEYRHKGDVIVFDDCDSVFQDGDALNLLKAACDTTERRRIMWGAETRMTDVDGAPLPWSFEFEGSIIFITNYDFDQAIEGGSRFSEHFKALISRSHYIDVGLRSVRDYLIRIKQVVGMGMLKDRGLNDFQQEEVIDYIFDNACALRELTLRMVIKVAELYVTEPTRWKSIAKVSLLKKK